MPMFQTPAQVARAKELLDMQEAGTIDELHPWHKIRLTEASVPFTATFSYFDLRRNCSVFESLKEKRDPTFKILARLWRRYGPGLLIVTERRNEGSRPTFCWVLKGEKA